MNRSVIMAHQIYGPYPLVYGEGVWTDRLHPIRNKVMYPVTRTIGDIVNVLEWRGHWMERPMAPGQ